MPFLNKITTINSRKLDGTIHKTWKANLLEKNDSLITFVGKFEKEINHSHLGLIRRGTISYEFYWLNCWFNVFRFHEPEGNLRNFYCNLTMPPIYENNVLDYVDLDIDVLVWKDFTVEILDLDEFERNSRKLNYSPEIKINTDQSLEKILEFIKNRTFPFSSDDSVMSNDI